MFGDWKNKKKGMMPNHCAIEGCTTGYKATEDRPPELHKIATFHYPLSKPDLLEKWIKFTNRKDWTPTASSVVCEKHFKEEALFRGDSNFLSFMP